MIRLILKTTFQDEHNGCSGEEYHTYEITEPELEAILLQGGRSETAHNRTQLMGCEIITTPDELES